MRLKAQEVPVPLFFMPKLIFSKYYIFRGKAIIYQQLEGMIVHYDSGAIRPEQ